MQKTLTTIRPLPILTVSQWADAERILSTESSSEPGRWRTSRAAYQRGVMDALSEPLIETIVCLKSSQVGYSELINNIFGYFIHQDPCPILMVMPTVDLAQSYSRDRLAPMIRDTPAIARLIKDPKSRETTNRMQQKVFPGGRLTMVGANAPSSLASRPIRVVLADEVDKFPASAGTEGDPLKLAQKRQSTFWNRKLVIGSTPAIKDTSVVFREWLRSDQRKFFVPCKDCAHPQVMTWANVRWDSVARNAVVPESWADQVVLKTASAQHLPSSAHYVCDSCGSIWEDVDRWNAVNRGEWTATAEFTGIAGFHIPQFLSPWVTLNQIVTEFLGAKASGNPNEMQVWTNSVLGEPWEKQAESVDSGDLIGRGEAYTPDSLPEGVMVVVAGVDVQDDRLELQTLGFGLGDEIWAIDYEVLRGKTSEMDVWNELDRALLHQYLTEDGRFLPVRAACVDSGFRSESVFSFCRKRRSRRIYATRGVANLVGPRPIWPKFASTAGKSSSQQVFAIGVDTAKEQLYGRLKIAKPGPGYIHYPAGDVFGEQYFEQLTSEQLVTTRRMGKLKREWLLPAHKRNEALDTFVLATAARMSLGVRFEVRAPIAPELPPPPEDFDPPPPPVPAAPAQGSGQKHSAFGQGQQGSGWLGPRRGGWFDRR